MSKVRTFKINLPDPEERAKYIVEKIKKKYPKTYKALGE